MQQIRPTFQDIDRLRAEREQKRVELVERLTKVLIKNFDANELAFVYHCEGDAIRIEAYERARGELVK